MGLRENHGEESLPYGTRTVVIYTQCIQERDKIEARHSERREESAFSPKSVGILHGVQNGASDFVVKQTIIPTLSSV
jgi:hypothetical protein